MVYEIYFCPEAGMWRIRIISYVLLFFPICRDVKVAADSDALRSGHVKQFSTFAQAVGYVQEIGLDSAYRRLERNGAVAQFNAVAVHATSA